MAGKLRSIIRILSALIAAVLLARHLSMLGWPWWAWLPAAILGAMTVFLVLVLMWFLYRKLTYRHFARRAKQRNLAAED